MHSTSVTNMPSVPLSISDLVRPQSDLGRREAAGRQVADQRARHRHQQRRRHAMPRDIRDHQHQPPLGIGEVVIEIAGHLAGGQIARLDLKRALRTDRRHLARQQAGLDLPGQFQFAFHPGTGLRFLPDPLHLLAELLQHRIEHPRQIRHFIAPRGSGTATSRLP